MTKNNILLTTVGGLTSPDIIHALREFPDSHIVGTDSFHLAVGRYFVDQFYVVPLSKNSEDYLISVQNIVNKENITLIIPCGNDDSIFFEKYKSKFSCRVMIANESGALNIAFNKKILYDFLKDSRKINAPNFFYVNNHDEFLESIAKIGYPQKKVVIKPEMGIGGRGVYILAENRSYAEVFENKPSAEISLDSIKDILHREKSFNLLVMEYLEEPFYSAYSLAYQGENLITLTHTREWGNASQTFRGQVIYSPEIEELANSVAQFFQLSYTFNMELACATDGRIVLYDLNPRIGASSGLDRHVGVNFPVLAARLALGENPESLELLEPSKIMNKRFIRYFSEVWNDV